ncbi:MAG: hypothetical protein JO199_13725 [Candidatus Eremiobacteraeota bacterium]|nr:hypothetical protein [Candidatus Eremiobacteraeota bacterium]
MKRLLCLALLSSIAAGCAGTSRLGGAPPFVPAAEARHHVSAVDLRIRIPKNHRARFVSPATQGMNVAIAGPTTVSKTVGLTPSSTGCTSSVTNTICEVTIALKPCPTPANCYTATIATYDAVSCGGSNCTIPPSANELSAAQSVAFNVKAGQTSALPLSLSGIPASIVVAPYTVFTLVDDNAVLGTPHLQLVGLGQHLIGVQALDADGNVIVGAGSPTYSLAKTGGTLGVTIARAASNVFSVTPPSTYSAASASLKVTASFSGQPTNGCTQPGASCTASLTATMVPMLVAADTTGGYGHGRINMFALGDATELAVVTQGIDDPVALAIDGSGNLYVGNGAGESVVEYPAGSTTASSKSFTLKPGGQNVTSLAVDSSNDLFVASFSTPVAANSAINEFNASGTNVFGATVTGVNGPVALAEDANKTLYVGNSGNKSVTEYNTGALSGAPAVTIVGFGSVNGIAVGAGASPEVYVADPLGSAVWRFPHGSNVSDGDLGPAQGLPNPNHIALDGLGNLYVSNQTVATMQFPATGAWPVSKTGSFGLYTADPTSIATDALNDLVTASPSNGYVDLWPPGSANGYPSMLFIDVSTRVTVIVVP